MKKNILIIEDDQTHYELVRDIIKGYGIDVFPSEEMDFKLFARLLREFGESKSDDLLAKVKQKICSYDFDFVILDRSFTSRLDDTSGLIVAEEILKNNFPRIEICYLSNYPNELNSDNYIEKNDHITLDANLVSKVISKLIEPLPLSQIDISKTAKENPNEKNPLTVSEIKKKIEKTSLPKWIEILAEKERFKLLPSISFLIDSSIKYLFYSSLMLLFVYAPIYLIWSLFKYKHNPMLIAENAFIVFLPFLITCGFYVFYVKSLSPYIRQKPIDKDDFESSSNLLKLTKKLFVSSLLSYLFIKLIELLLLEGENNVPPPFSEKYKIDNPLALLYFVIGFIVILLLYYIYIDRNHNPKTTDVHK